MPEQPSPSASESIAPAQPEATQDTSLYLGHFGGTCHGGRRLPSAGRPGSEATAAAGQRKIPRVAAWPEGWLRSGDREHLW